MHDEVTSTIMKKINKFIDNGSFSEIDSFSGEGVIAGYGTVNGRPICLFAQDDSVMSGAITYKNCEKICKIIDMSVKLGVPLIGIYDSIGVKVSDNLDTISSMQKVLSKLSNASGVIPQIAIITGDLAGISSFAASVSDFIFMIDGKSRMFINGPQVITSVSGTEAMVESYGGARAHFENTGICQLICDSDEDCSNKFKKILDFIPDNNLSDSEFIDEDDINRNCEELLNEKIDCYQIINSICDKNDFFEINSGFAKNIITGFGRIGGKVSGIIANNSSCLDGKLTINASEKACRFVKFCDAFNIPLVTLVDNDGFLPSLDEEMGGVARKGAALLFTYSGATVPKINLIFGKSFASANLVMGASPDITFAWEGARISVVSPTVAVNVLYSKEITDAESPVEFRNDRIKEYIDNDALPNKAFGIVDEVISPVDTRKKIINAIYMFSSKRENGPVRRHESISF